jgi:hypothetical protein
VETVGIGQMRKHTAYGTTRFVLKKTLPILFLVLVQAHAIRRILSPSV